MAEEIDVIQHLIEVEKNAASIIQEAQAEADNRIANARAKADSEFQAKYAALYGQLEEDANKKIEQAKIAHDEEITRYKQTLQSNPQNQQAFTSLMNSLLFG